MTYVQKIADAGFCIIPGALTLKEVDELLARVQSGLASGSQGSIKSSRGETYAARNLVEMDPILLDAWKKPVLTQLLRSVLGESFGLVRVLYFDKHPNRTWSLPWHKDMTIAVKDNSIPSSKFSKPTCKSGIDHLEASTELLQQMLTLRIHLDEVTVDNGPLEVARGSHKNGKRSATSNDVEKILVQAGDVLAMRPLVSHASGSSTPGTQRHRRILHLEFSGQSSLPDGLEWHRFYSD